MPGDIPIRGDGLVLNRGSSAGDHLTLVGGTLYGSVDHTFESGIDTYQGGCGTITSLGFGTGPVLYYTGIESIQDDLNADSRDFTFMGGTEEITLADDSFAVSGLSAINASAGVPVTFRNPNVALSVGSNGADDHIIVAGLDPSFAADLRLQHLLGVFPLPGKTTFNMTSPDNDVDALSAAAGALHFRDGDDLCVGSSGISTSTGDITLHAGGPLAIDDCVIQSAGGNITLIADEIAIGPAAVVDAGAGIVAVAPATTGRPLDLGTETAGSLSLTDAELDRIAAGALRIGSSTSGDITISSDTDPAGTETLHLLTGGAVRQTAIVRETNLAVEAGSSVSLYKSNEVETVAIANTVGTLSFVERGGFTVGTVDGVAGVNGPGISLRSQSGTPGDGSITIATANGVHGNWADITSDGTLTIETGAEASVTTGQQYLLLKADRMRLLDEVSVPVGEKVWILPVSTDQMIDLGSTTDAATGTLELSDVELDHITAGVLQIGGSNAGAITISAQVDTAGTDALHLISGAAVSQAADLTVSQLAVEAQGNVDLSRPWNDFGTVAAVAASTAVVSRAIASERRVGRFSSNPATGPACLPCPGARDARIGAGGAAAGAGAAVGCRGPDSYPGRLTGDTAAI